MKWIKAEEQLPKTEGTYIVKMSTGSIAPKIKTIVTTFANSRFSGAFDWNYVIEWLDETQPSPLSEDWKEQFEKAVQEIKLLKSDLQTIHDYLDLLKVEKKSSVIERIKLVVEGKNND